VHEARCEPGLIEFRPEPQAPPDLAARLSELLGKWTGRRWLASVVREEGQPTLAVQKAANASSLRSQAEANPLVQAILKTFPGARIEAVRRKGEETSLVAGLASGPSGVPVDEPPAGEDYPVDDDIPESDS
jgi:DNA polymerase-3 subunit gamma/tau